MGFVRSFLVVKVYRRIRGNRRRLVLLILRLETLQNRRARQATCLNREVHVAERFVPARPFQHSGAEFLRSVAGNNHSRFFVKVGRCQTWSSTFRPTNQRTTCCSSVLPAADDARYARSRALRAATPATVSLDHASRLLYQQPAWADNLSAQY